MEKTKNVIGYCRVSTKEQELGNSLDWQEEYIRRYCKAKKYNLIAIYREDKSGRTFEKRTVFKELMKYCKEHRNEVDSVLVYRWDRYSRSLKKALINMEFFEKYGIEVNSIEQHIDFRAPDHITILSIYFSQAESEDNKISRRTKECIHKAKENGKCTNKAPRGYINKQIDDEHRYVDIDTEQVDYIRYAFQEVAKGVKAPTSICRDLNKMGFKIHKNSFFKMLRNVFYKGYILVPAYHDGRIQIDEHIVKGVHQPIIDEETFDIVQSVIGGKGRVSPKTTKVLNPEVYLRKYLVCPKCGASLTGSGSTGNGGKYYYYHCSKDGKHFRCNASVAHKLFRRYLQTLKPNKAVLALYEEVLKDIQADKYKESDIEISKLHKELERCELRRENIGIKYMDGEIDKVTYDKFNMQIDKEAKKFQDRIELLETAKRHNLEPKINYSMLLINNLETFIDEAPTETKCKLIGSMFIDKIEFDGKKYRTKSYNKVLDLIYQQTSELRKQNEKDSSDFSEESLQVPPQGLEPWSPTLRVSCSTN